MKRSKEESLDSPASTPFSSTNLPAFTAQPRGFERLLSAKKDEVTSSTNEAAVMSNIPNKDTDTTASDTDLSREKNKVNSATNISPPQNASDEHTNSHEPILKKGLFRFMSRFGQTSNASNSAANTVNNNDALKNTDTSQNVLKQASNVNEKNVSKGLIKDKGNIAQPGVEGQVDAPEKNPKPSLQQIFAHRFNTTQKASSASAKSEQKNARQNEPENQRVEENNIAVKSPQKNTDDNSGTVPWTHHQTHSPSPKRKQGNITMVVDKRDILPHENTHTKNSIGDSKEKNVVGENGDDGVQHTTLLQLTRQQYQGNSTHTASVMHYRKPIDDIRISMSQPQDTFVESKATGEFHVVNKKKMIKLGIIKKENRLLNEAHDKFDWNKTSSFDTRTAGRLARGLQHFCFFIRGVLCGVSFVMIAMYLTEFSRVRFLALFSPLAITFHLLLSTLISISCAYTMKNLFFTQTPIRTPNRRCAPPIRRKVYRKICCCKTQSSSSTIIANFMYIIAFVVNLLLTQTDHEIFLRFNENSHWYTIAENFEAFSRTFDTWCILNVIRCVCTIVGWGFTVQTILSIDNEILQQQEHGENDTANFIAHEPA